MSDRYANMTYRRAGRSGVLLPSLSLGLWHNFGDDHPVANQRAVVHRAFDLGITHFDLANNYGPPYGSAEANFGRLLREGFGAHRDEILISTKAGWDMWPGPYGDHGSRKYLLASLDQSLGRLGVEYVDIFYSHRPDPDTPLEETMGALHSAVQQGKALYVGISSYGPQRTHAAALLLREMGTPLLIHQPSYSMLNRWIETALLDELAAGGVGCIAFTVVAQGLLTEKYLSGARPQGSRADTLPPAQLTSDNLSRIGSLAKIAHARGQSLAQLALAWALRDSRMTSLVVGASTVEQLEENVAALGNLALSEDELREIDNYAVESGVDLWREQSDEP